MAAGANGGRRPAKFWWIAAAAAMFLVSGGVLVWVFGRLAALQTPALTSRLIFPGVFMAVPVAQLILVAVGAWSFDGAGPSPRKAIWIRRLTVAVKALNFFLSFFLATLFGSLYSLFTGPMPPGMPEGELVDAAHAYIIGAVTIVASQYLGWVVASREMRIAEAAIAGIEERVRIQGVLRAYGLEPQTLSGLAEQGRVTAVELTLKEVVGRIDALAGSRTTFKARFHNALRAIRPDVGHGLR